LAASLVINGALESVNWIWTTALGFVSTLSLATGLIAAAGAFLLSLFKPMFTRIAGTSSLMLRWVAVGLDLVALILAVLGAFYISGPVLFFLDMFAVLIGLGGLAFYAVESANPVQQGLDVISSVSVVFEEVVVYGTVPVASAAMVEHVLTGKDNG
jgi:hypothetical protein